MRIFKDGFHGYYDPTEDLSKIHFGRGCIEHLNAEVELLGTRALLLTSPSIRAQQDVMDIIKRGLGPRLVGVYSDIKPHTPRSAVLEVVQFAKELDLDVVISLGGGSVTDTTKALRMALWLDIQEREDFDSAYKAYKGGWSSLNPEQLNSPMLPQIGIPTTLISAEPTQGMGITDDEGHGKQVFSHPQLKSNVIFLDPELSTRTPETLWLSSGIKAMEHAIAKLSVRERDPVIDPIAAEAVAILGEDLINCKLDAQDLTARGNVLIASWLCMFGSWRSLVTRMGLSHALGRQVGGISGASHGLISGVLLPLCMEFNAPAGGSGLFLEARALNLDIQGISSEEAGLRSAARVKEIVESLQLPSRLRDIGVNQIQLPAIAEQTMTDMSVVTNPRKIRDSAEVLELLEAAW